MLNKVHNMDFRDGIIKLKKMYPNRRIVVLSDPPYNINFKYNQYKDNLEDKNYIEMINKLDVADVIAISTFPELAVKYFSKALGVPTKIITWVYRSNLRQHHRHIYIYGAKPILENIRKPYTDYNDPKIKERVSKGFTSAREYDWWWVQTKRNSTKEKEGDIHPASLPVELMEREVVSLTTKNDIVVDPFMGSGTTGIACVLHGRDFVGFEISKEYADWANEAIHKTKPLPINEQDIYKTKELLKKEEELSKINNEKYGKPKKQKVDPKVMSFEDDLFN